MSDWMSANGRCAFHGVQGGRGVGLELDCALICMIVCTAKVGGEGFGYRAVWYCMVLNVIVWYCNEMLKV